MVSITSRIRAAAELHGHFVLRSGKVSDTYFDKYRFEADPKLLRDIAEKMRPLIPEATEALAGLEMGGIPIATVLSQLTGIATAFIRKEPKTYGTCRYAEGVPLEGKLLILVEGVVSSGGALLDAVAMLRRDGISVSVPLCVIDRDTGGREALADAGIKLRSLLRHSDLGIA